MLTRALTGLVVMLALVGWFVEAGPALAAADGHTADSASEHGETAEPGGGSMNPLDFKADLAIWTGVVFLVLLAILWKFAWGPIADGLDKREKRIADEIASAKKTNVDARELLAEYQQKLAASEEDVRRMIEAAKRDAEKVGEGIVDKARHQAEAEHRRALEEIDLATAGALEELAQRSATLAVELAGKIVQARLDPAAHSQLIERAVTKFSKAEPGNN